MEDFKGTEKKSINKRTILIIILSSVLVAIGAIWGIIYSVNKTKSTVELEINNSGKSSILKALTKSARTGNIINPKNEGIFACFQFTEEQQAEIEKYYGENKDIALAVRISKGENSSNQKASVKFGFLYDEDFTEKGKFIVPEYLASRRVIIQSSLNEAPAVFDLSFAFKTETAKNKLPKGFFIYTTGECNIIGAKVVPVEIGFDVSKDVPFYGFSCNGGVVDFSNKTFDFSGASLILPTKSSELASLPEYSIKFSPNPEYKSSQVGSVYSYINFGGEKLKLKNVAPANEVIIPTGGLKSPFSNMKIESNEMCIVSVILRPTYVAGDKVLKPVKTDPGLILNYRPDTWRTVDYALFEWDRYPKILFFDTRNYDIQDKFFRRLAYYVEKNGYKGRLMTNEELEGKHGYNAHDYSAISMASFFNKAHDMNFQLNPEELLLKEILIENKLFEVEGDYVKPNEGGIVSISQESRPALRETFLAHEGWHTIFFRDEEFRNYVATVYYTLDPKARTWLADYFTANPSLQYDTNDDYLMKNEFMAYIMQQDLSEVADYFVSRAEIGYVKAYTPALSDYIIKTHAAAFEDAAHALNEFVFDKYGIVCGNISLVSK